MLPAPPEIKAPKQNQPPSNTPHPASSGQTAAGLVVPSPHKADESKIATLAPTCWLKSEINSPVEGKVVWLVVEPTHLKNMLVKMDHFPRVRGENKKYLKPPPSSLSHYLPGFKKTSFRW